MKRFCGISSFGRNFDARSAAPAPTSPPLTALKEPSEIDVCGVWFVDELTKRKSKRGQVEEKEGSLEVKQGQVEE